MTWPAKVGVRNTGKNTVEKENTQNTILRSSFPSSSLVSQFRLQWGIHNIKNTCSCPSKFSCSLCIVKTRNQWKDKKLSILSYIWLISERIGSGADDGSEAVSTARAEPAKKWGTGEAKGNSRNMAILRIPCGPKRYGSECRKQEQWSMLVLFLCLTLPNP